MNKCLPLLLLISALANSNSLPNFDSTHDDCCELTWEPVIDGGDRRFIPSTAIPFGTTPFSSTVYFARRPDVGTPQVGAIDDRIEQPVYIWPLDYPSITVQGWTNTYVLANPNNCDLTWQLHNSSVLLNRTAALEFPSIDGYFFARIGDSLAIAPIRGGLAKGIWMKGEVPTITTTAENFAVLTINCVSSLRKTLQSELFDMEFDASALMSPDEGLRVLSLTEVINDSDFDQTATIDLESEVLSSLEISHETRLYSMVDTKWGVHGSVKLGWVAKFIGLSGSIDAGYDSHSVKSNFTRTGQISFDSRRKQFKYKENIVVKARTKSKVTMNTQPIGGAQKFTAHYRIKSLRANGNLTLNQVSNLLRRQGFAGWDKLTLNQSGDIVYKVEGSMQIDAGVDTHVLIESSPLPTANGSTFANSTRVVRGLDQLSLPLKSTHT